MMPDLGKYAGTVLLAYGVTIFLVAAIVGLSWLQSRRARVRLAEIEGRKGGDHG